MGGRASALCAVVLLCMFNLCVARQLTQDAPLTDIDNETLIPETIKLLTGGIIKWLIDNGIIGPKPDGIIGIIGGPGIPKPDNETGINGPGIIGGPGIIIDNGPKPDGIIGGPGIIIDNGIIGGPGIIIDNGIGIIGGPGIPKPDNETLIKSGPIMSGPIIGGPIIGIMLFPGGPKPDPKTTPTTP